MEKDLIPLIGTIFVLTIPIVAILTTHQQKMAKLMREDSQALNNPNDISALRHDVQQLREVVTSLAITVDNMNDRLDRQSNLETRMKVHD